MDNQSFDIRFQPNHHLQIDRLIKVLRLNNMSPNKLKNETLTKSQIYNNIFFAEMVGHVAIGVWEVSDRKALQDGII